MKLWLSYLIIFIIFLLTACGGPTPETQSAQPLPAVSANTPTLRAVTPSPATEPTQMAAETAAITLESMAETTSAPPTATAAEVAATLEIVDWLTVEGKTPDNFTYLGNPNAPITLIDYSDFL